MIKVIYNKVCGRCVQSEPLTSGMVGQTIELEYSADFDGLAVTAVFTDGANTVDVVNPGNECVIPHEVLTTVGAMVKVGIYAVRGDELVIPTVYANIGTVLKGADPSGDVSIDPTLPVWAQTQAIIGNLNDLNTEAKNNLVEAINEVKQSGGGGSTVELDTTLTQSGKAADAKAVGDALAGKQDKLIAGDNITIAADGKTISAKGGSTVPKPLTYDYMPEGYPSKSVQTTTLMEEQELAFAHVKNGVYALQEQIRLPLVRGQSYTVNWDGAKYECVCVDSNRTLTLGNLSIMGEGEDTGEPFLYKSRRFGTLDTSAIHTISVKTIEETVTPIAEKFLPESVATKSDVEVAQTAATNAQAVAENAQSTANTAQTTAENAVKYTTSQDLTAAQKQQARANIGAGTSSFSGDYNDLAGKPVSLSTPTQSDTYITQIDVLDYTTTSDSVKIFSTQYIFDISSSIFTVLNKTEIYEYYDGGRTLIYSPSLVADWELIDSVKVNDAVYYGIGIGDSIGTLDEKYFFISNNGFIIISPSIRISVDLTKYFKIIYGGASLEMPIVYLSERFIPPAIQRVGDDLILSSSTAESTKKFKITVDDAGTLSATEITNQSKGNN